MSKGLKTLRVFSHLSCLVHSTEEVCFILPLCPDVNIFIVLRYGPEHLYQEALKKTALLRFQTNWNQWYGTTWSDVWTKPLPVGCSRTLPTQTHLANNQKQNVLKLHILFFLIFLEIKINHTNNNNNKKSYKYTNSSADSYHNFEALFCCS